MPPRVILLDHWAPQPEPNEPQHRAIGDPSLELLHQTVMVIGVEVTRQVRVIHLRPASLEGRLHLVQRLMRVPPRTKSEGAPSKSAAKIGSITKSVAICATRSRTVGIPNGRNRPSGFGM